MAHTHTRSCMQAFRHGWPSPLHIVSQFGKHFRSGRVQAQLSQDLYKQGQPVTVTGPGHARAAQTATSQHKSQIQASPMCRVCFCRDTVRMDRYVPRWCVKVCVCARRQLWPWAFRRRVVHTCGRPLFLYRLHARALAPALKLDVPS